MNEKGIFPKVYLAVDNCIASKRWTEPKDWMSLMADLGVYHVEASADNEADVLYTPNMYQKKWLDQLANESVKSGVQICNFYSGHGTYATTGLSHSDKLVRDHIMEKWLKRMIDNASLLNAGVGFYCHAFNRNILNDKELYKFHLDDLYQRLSFLSTYANQKGLKTIGVEQMYTPHQVPWTVQGARELIKKVTALSGNPFYITIDVGHQSGQRKFVKPQFIKLKELVEKCRLGKEFKNTWLGNERAYDYFQKAVNATVEKEDHYLKKIMDLVESHAFLFAEYEDGDPYYWLENLGAYSPIIHLQQTNGHISSHWPFNEEYNKKGIIDGEKILKSLYNSFKRSNNDMPTRCGNIYLTIEIFGSTAEIPYDIIKKLKESVEYWRQFIPEDGLSLEQLVEHSKYQTN